MDNNVAMVMIFSAVVLANFYGAAILFIIRRRNKGTPRPLNGGKGANAIFSRLPRSMKKILNKIFRQYHFVTPCYKGDYYSSAVPVGELRAFGGKQLSDQLRKTSNYIH